MWKRRFVETMVERRSWVIGIVAALTVASLPLVARVELESSIEIWFLDDDPALVSYHAFLDRFGADEFTLVALYGDDVFSPRALRVVDELTEAARQAPYTHRVMSLTTVQVFHGADGLVEVAPLVESLPETPAEADAIRAKALETGWVRGNLVNAEGTATAVIVEMDPAGNTAEGKRAIIAVLREAAAKAEAEGFGVRLAGSTVFDAAFFELSERDFGLFGPAALLVLVILITAVYRRPSGVFVPLTVVIVTILWTHAVLAALGLKLNIVSIMLSAVILAVGVADSIHVLSEYYRKLAGGIARREAVIEAVGGLIVPCFFTSATTMVGLLALTTSTLAPIREFGFFAALGVFLAFALSITFVPAILQVARPPDEAFLERQRSGPLNRWLERLGRPDPLFGRVALGFTLVVTLALLAVLPSLEVGSNPINYFKASNPVRQDFAAVDDSLGGALTFEFLVSSPDRGLLEPAHLARLEELQSWIGDLPAVSQTLSILDGLKEMNRTFHDGDDSHAVLPDSRNLTAQYYLLMEGEEDFDALLQDDYSIGRLTARGLLTRSGEIIERLDDVDVRLTRDFPADELRVEATGFMKLMARMEVYLVNGQIRSILIALVAITGMMMLLLRSLRLGLFSMIPNIGPIVVGLGVMALSGIPLDPGTAMIASIALGLIVDDSVHFLHRLRENLMIDESLEGAIARTMNETGRPIVITSIVLASSFSVLALGSFLPNVYFGLVSSLVILLALVADLVVLPAALILIRPQISPSR